GGGRPAQPGDRRRRHGPVQRQRGEQYPAAAPLAAAGPGLMRGAPMSTKPPRPELADARRQGLHNIGEASALSGVSAKMIRHYESIGLIPPPARSFANYRLYRDADVHRLRLIRRARDLGFPMKQIETLLALWGDPQRSSAEVKRVALEHVGELSERIRQMQAMQRTLEHLAHCCQGDDRPDCPILDDLAGEQ